MNSKNKYKMNDVQVMKGTLKTQSCLYRYDVMKDNSKDVDGQAIAVDNTASPTPKMLTKISQSYICIQATDTSLWKYNRKSHTLIITGKGGTNNEDAAIVDEEIRMDLDDNPRYEIGSFLLDSNADTRDVKYEIINNTKKIIIKDGITTINSAAFASFKKLKKIIIPSSVKQIGDFAFKDCKSLQEIKIPDYVQSIGTECFGGCKALRKVVLGKKLVKLGTAPFMQCYLLNSIVIRKGNKQFINKRGCLYDKKRKILYFYYANSSSPCIIEGTTIIGEFAFSGRKKVKKVIIPASVVRVGGGAFENCSNLREIKFAKGSKCKNIYNYPESPGSSPIGNCKKLKYFKIPSHVKYISKYFFEGCDSLEFVCFGRNFKGYRMSFGDKDIFDDSASLLSKKLKKIQVARKNNYFESIDGVLFDKQKKRLLLYPMGKNAETYLIPEGTKSICNSAFRQCIRLKKIIITDEKLELRYKRLFDDCKRLILFVKKDSKALKYARKYKIKYKIIR